jgi:HNH endonuclease
MMNPTAESDQLKSSDMIPDFWNILHLFWDEDRVEKWRSSQNPDIGVEGCVNLISLSPNAHDMWNRGLFALKPLELSPDRKKLTVQFFWQVPGGYKMKSRIDLLTEPASSEGLDFVGEGYFLSRYENDVKTPHIQSGETFTFTTEDPKNLPLPSVELLEMQWILQRLVGMCGAAEWPSLDMDDDDIADNDGWLFLDYARTMPIPICATP